MIDCGEVSCEYCSKDKCIYMTDKIDVLNKIHEPKYQHEGEDWTMGLCIAQQIIDKYKE